ncbi:ImmA/IrrE family metallo-endopeptidase [Nereida sp. MMG025]|uniref:ImmA/IrrE family metallo-endopeptidase n=1 Tax=Nereida sp. MMG025 TaxID=2909981 RepID=UPI001F3E225E|nr:M48 family metallopeptidase [Nereida sp. MMG025]MCF6445694.1 M48 family metallopeptidase [Nereida sp. MMG025]
MKGEFQFPKGRGLTVEILNKRDVNASAAISPDQSAYVIRLHIGLFVWAYGISAAATAMYESEFDTSGERTITLSKYRHHSSSRYVEEQLARADAELDQLQDGYAETLFQLILLTVFAHELAHIVRGHVDDLHDRSGGVQSFLDELMMTSDTAPLQQGRIRAYEYDADRFAAGLLFELANDPPDILERWCRNTPTENLSVVLFANALFNAAVYETQTQNRQVKSIYPSPMLRYSTAVSQMKRAHIDRFGEDGFEEEVLQKSMGMLSVHEAIFPVIDHFRLFNRPEALVALRSESEAVITDFEDVQEDLRKLVFPPQKSEV